MLMLRKCVQVLRSTPGVNVTLVYAHPTRRAATAVTPGGDSHPGGSKEESALERICGVTTVSTPRVYPPQNIEINTQ